VWRKTSFLPTKRKTMDYRKHVLIALLLCTYAVAQSQIVNIERRRIATDSTGWFGQANVSFSGSKNTKSVLALASGLLVEYKSKSTKDLWLLISDLSLISADKEKFSNAGFGHLRYNKKLGEAVRWEVFTQLQYNSLTHIEHRFLVGSGPRFKLTQYEKAKFYLGIAYMFEQEKLLAPKVFLQDHRLSNYFSFSLMPEEEVSFASTIYIQPLLRQFEDYRISNETALTLAITDKLDLSAVFRYSYDSKPPLDVPKSIYSFANTILVEF
jgi:putative salt-induced outer membrane protein YdiY